MAPPPGLAAAAVCSSCAFRRPASTTEYPASCKARLAARPIPLPAPVTTAILLVISIHCHLESRLHDSVSRGRASEELAKSTVSALIDCGLLWGGQFWPQPAFSRLLQGGMCFAKSRMKGGCGQD